MTSIEYGDGQIAVLCLQESLLNSAKSVAAKLDTQVQETSPNTYQGEADYLLVYGANGVELLPADKKQGGAVKVCFTAGKADHRRKYGGGAGQMIAKAVGIKSGLKPQVFDATAGLGQDSFVLASLGCSVTAMERSPVVYELLKSGLDQAKCAEDEEVKSIADRITLMPGNAIDWLTLQSETIADVVYLDPMFPEKGKSSLAKKEMRYFKQIVGKDEDAAELLSAAIEKARYRVVVKRPRLAPTIPGIAPSYAIEGKSNRYDIYAFKSLEGLKINSE